MVRVALVTTSDCCQPMAFEDIDEVPGGLVEDVDLIRLRGRQPGGGVCAVVDELDPIQIGSAIYVGAPPVFAPLEHCADADLDLRDREGAGAHNGRGVARVEGKVRNGRGVVSHARDDRDVGARKMQPYSKVVDDLYRAFGEVAGWFHLRERSFVKPSSCPRPRSRTSKRRCPRRIVR